MAGSCINGMTHARCGSISSAVIGCAEVRAALHYFSRDRDVWHLWVVTLFADDAARFDSAAARSWKILMWLVPVRSPLPYVSDHVVEAVPVRRKGSHRRSSLISIRAQILDRKVSLPGVSHNFAAWRELISPGVFHLRQSAARGKLPFRLCRQFLSRPYSGLNDLGTASVSRDDRAGGGVV
jgi:hypothetical protein